MQEQILRVLRSFGRFGLSRNSLWIIVDMKPFRETFDCELAKLLLDGRVTRQIWINKETRQEFTTLVVKD